MRTLLSKPTATFHRQAGADVPVVAQFGGRPGALAITSAYHGPFWPTGVNLGPFSWEFWSCLLDTSILGYLISEGYGGAHSILFTVNPGPTGNIWTGSTTTSFGGGYTAQPGEWLHSRVGWDGTHIFCWVNGIVVAITPFAGPRQAQMGTLFIGGSDHSNFTGRIAMVRGFEGICPLFLPAGHSQAFTPERVFSDRPPPSSTVTQRAQFCAHYLGYPSARAVPDIGSGYGGALHPGIIQPASNGIASAAFLQPPPGPVWVADPTAPFSSVSEPARTRVPASPTAAPGGTKIWDSVGRADSIPAFTSLLSGGICQTSPGSTEGGTLGPQAWTHVNPAVRWGVFDQSLVCFATSANTSIIYVTNDSGDMDVRFDRHDAAGYGASLPIANPLMDQSPDNGIVFRMQDNTNYLKAQVYHDQFGNNRVEVYSVVAGVTTSLAQWTLPNYTWTTLRITAVGTTITGYADAAQIGQLTGVSTFQAATKAGLIGGGGTAARVTNFSVR